MSLLPSGAIETGGYDINNSLRFRASASASLTRTFSTPTNNRKWTMSLWVKRGALGQGQIFAKGNTSTAPWTLFYFDSNNALNLYEYSLTGTAANFNLATNAVFRDPSAWYHIVVAVDTTLATAANRQIVYVNNVQQTFSSASYYPQNTDTQWNSSGGTSYIFQQGAGATTYLDGYLAETHFVDGQQLTPSSFGETDAVTGVWKPKKYTGTYGTNGFYLPFTQNTNSAYAVYTTDAASNYHSLPTGSQGTNFTFSGDFTIEGWVLYSSAVGDQSFYVSNSGSAYLALNIEMSTGNYNIYLNSSTPSGTFASGITVGNWTHVAMVRSGSTITLYTNGVAKGTITNSSTLGYSTLTLNRFGGGVSGARFLSNVRITKSAVYTANFVPPTTALTNIANTVVLTYQNATAIDNSSNGYTLTATGSPSMLGGNVIWNANIISDASGNKNHWTPNNLNYSFYGTTYDAMTDSPTLTSATVANYCTMNPLESFTNPVPQQANLYVPGTDYSQVKGTFWVSTGKWYFEWVSVGSNLPPYVGVSNASITSNTNVTTSGISWYGHSNSYYKNFTGTSLVATSAISVGDVIGVAFDCDAGTVAYYKNNSLVHTDTTLTPNQLVAPTLIGTFSGGSWSAAAFNFGQRPFAYTPPTGYKALNTYNLPDSTIKKGSDYFGATLYTGTTTGTGQTQTISHGQSFTPNLVWIKNRSAAHSHQLYDVIRGYGSNKNLKSNATDEEGLYGDTNGYVSAVSSSQITTVSGSNATAYGEFVNQNTRTYVGWLWAANGAGVTNTSGTITSTVSVNATAGFSIVTYTGNATANATVGHGLGVAPKFFVVKTRSGTSEWLAYHISTGKDGFMQLQSTSAFSSSANYWGSTGPTSTTFQINGGGGVNNNGSTYVAYCWAEIAGFSAFGSYTGNSSTDGPFVYCGFRPKFIIIKRSNGVSNWNMFDTSRDSYNVMDKGGIIADGSDAESSWVNFSIDSLSNGFKLRSSWVNLNQTGGTYIYMAFAESPFKNSLAR